jgi:Domain of unknown function (DUF4157)
MKHTLPNNEKKEAPTQATLSQKKSSHSFFGSDHTFFPKPAIQAKSNPIPETISEEQETGIAETLVQKLSAPVSDNNNAISATPPPKSNLAIQRKCDDCEQEDELQKKDEPLIQKKEAVASPPPPPPPPAATGTPQATTPANSPVAAKFIVMDNAVPETNQMRKTVFLDRLKTEVCTTVNQALVGTGFTSDNCPYIQSIFSIHQNNSPAHIEALIFRYCPAAVQAQTAEALIEHIKIKTFTTALHWARNGGMASGAAQIFNGISNGIGSIAGSVTSGIGSAASAIGSLFFKEDTGGAKNIQSPQAVMQSLGKGNTIESGTRSKMEGAFGTSFADVEVHTDSTAAQLSHDMNARAFTVGNHVAFGGGEHQPGTIGGDILMAHELAHVQQQRGGENINTGNYNQLEQEADSMAVNALSGKGKVQAERKTGLSLQRCSSDKPGYEELESNKKQQVEDYMYGDVLNAPDEPDQIPDPMNMTWAGDPFLLTFKFDKKNENSGKFIIKLDFTGKHNPLNGASLMDTSENFELELWHKGSLNVLVEEPDVNTLIIWPYGKAPTNMRLEFKHEGPHFHNSKDSRGRLHHFTFRNRTSNGYISSPFYIADKDAKAGDYPEAPSDFYPEDKGPMGSAPEITSSTPTYYGTQTRLDLDADYYKETVLRWSATPSGDDIKYNATAYYIPSDPQGVLPKSFSFTVKKDTIRSVDFNEVTNITDGGSETQIGLGDFSRSKVVWSFPVPKINGNQVVYTWKVNNGQTGEFSFPLQADYHKPDPQVEIPEKGTKTTTRIWGQDVHFGPFKDNFRVTMGVFNEQSKDAFLNIRSVGNAAIAGTGNLKVPLPGIDAGNPFLPEVQKTDGRGLEITIDKNKTTRISLYDLIAQEATFSGTDNARKHRIRVKGTTLDQDYFFTFGMENHQFKKDGTLEWSASGSQALNKEDSFRADTATLSLDTITDTKTFDGRIAEYEREFMFVRKKAHEEGFIKENVFQAWANLNGLILLYRVEPANETKKNLLQAIDTYVTAYGKTNIVTASILKSAIETGKTEKIATYYLNLIKPMDQEIIDKFSTSPKEVLKDTGLKAAYLLDVTGQMNELREYQPLRIPATFAIKELYMAGKPNFGHSLELVAYKQNGRLHLKNLTNRKEVGHVETSIASGDENKPVGDLIISTGLVASLNDPDLFPAGLLIYRVPGYTSARLETEGGMSATSYAKIIGGAIAITGLVLIAIASFGTLAPEAAAGVAAVGAWMMLVGDLTVLGAAAIDIVADRYNKGHFDSKRVLINLFDAATALLSAGSLTLGKVALSGARAARTGAEISNLAKFAGKWYTTVQLAQGVAGVMGVILVAEDAIQKIKAISNMKEGEGRNEAAISLFWHLLSIGAIAVLGLAGSRQMTPNKTDLLILSYAKAASGTVPVAFMGGISRFTRAHVGEFTDEAAALKFIENNLTTEAKAWFNAKYAADTPAARLARLEGIEGAWEPHGLDINGALTASAAKTRFKAAGLLTMPTDAQLAARYTRLDHAPFVNWTSSVVNLAATGINNADNTMLLNMLEASGHGYSSPLNAAEATALQVILTGLRAAYQADTTGNLKPNIIALAPQFTALGGAVDAGVVAKFKIRLSNLLIQDKVLYGRTQALPAAGVAPVGENQRTVVGAHSARILSDPRYEFLDATGNRIADPVNNITPNSDGTFNVNFRKDIGFVNPDPTKPNLQGRKNNPKPSTLAPLAWTDNDILMAGQKVAEFGATSGTSKYGKYKGVNWTVVLEDGAITASYPLGPTPAMPAGITIIPVIP